MGTGLGTLQGPLRCASVTERNGRGRARPQSDGLGLLRWQRGASPGGRHCAVQAGPLEARKGSLGVAAGAGHSRRGGTFGARTHRGGGCGDHRQHQWQCGASAGGRLSRGSGTERQLCYCNQVLAAWPLARQLVWGLRGRLSPGATWVVHLSLGKRGTRAPRKVLTSATPVGRMFGRQLGPLEGRDRMSWRPLAAAPRPGQSVWDLERVACLPPYKRRSW